MKSFAILSVFASLAFLPFANAGTTGVSTEVEVFESPIVTEYVIEDAPVGYGSSGAAVGYASAEATVGYGSSGSASVTTATSVWQTRASVRQARRAARLSRRSSRQARWSSLGIGRTTITSVGYGSNGG